MSQDFGSPITDKTKDAREALRLALGLGEDVPFADYINHIPSQWSPLEVFKDGRIGFWYEPSDIATLFQDAAGLIPVAANNDPIGKIKDKSGNGFDAIQTISARRMTYKKSPARFVSDRIDDALIVSTPEQGWSGTMVIATDLGTAAYEVNLPANSYNLGDRFSPLGDVIGVLFREGGLTKEESLAVEKYFVSRGARESYLNQKDLRSTWYLFQIMTEMPVTNITGASILYSAWSNCKGLTEFPLLDTSNALDFSNAWSNCESLISFPLINTSNAKTLSSSWHSCRKLESFPLINTSKVTDFSYSWYRCMKIITFPPLDMSSGQSFTWTWYNCTSLTSFPSNMFNKVKTGSFSEAFSNTNLSQESIDGILISLVTSGVATGTRVFNQSGGEAPSTIGKAAIDTLRNRGWTVTVTGDY